MATQGDPFKMTTVALLIIAVVMALVFSTRAMRRKTDDKERMAAARDEVKAVDLFLADEDLPNAVVALHDVSLRLARVEGAEDAAMKVSDTVRAALEAHGNTKSELKAARTEVENLKGRLTEMRQLRDRNLNRAVVLETLRDRNALILTNLLSGQFALARRLLDSTPEKDVVAEAADRLLGRLEAFNEAANAAGAERVQGLRALARVWTIPGLANFAELVGEAEARRIRVRDDLAGADRALEGGDAKTARALLMDAFRAGGLPEAETLRARLLRLEARGAAEAAEKGGDLPAAIAGYRFAGDAEATRRVERRHLSVQHAEMLKVAAAKALGENRLLPAAELFLAVQQLNGDPQMKVDADRLTAEYWSERVNEHLKTLSFGAAREAASLALLHDPEGSAGLLDRITEVEVDFRAAEALTRAREALDAGAPHLAASLIEGHTAPDELRAEIEVARREAVRRDARLALQKGDAKRALSLLEKIDDEGPLFARASLLAGDVEKGLSGLPRGAEPRSVLLLDAGWTVLEADPARAARIGLAALTATGIRPATVALLVAALKRAGDVPKGDKLWDEVKAVIFEASSPMPGEK